MTSSAIHDFLSEVNGDVRIPANKLAYFQTRLVGRIHQGILAAFSRLERETKHARKALARRIGRSPEQITRWFSYPGNLTLNTASDIFIGMGFEMESFTLVNVKTGARIQCPEQHPDLRYVASIYETETELAASSRGREPRRRDAAGEQAVYSRSSAQRLGYERTIEPSAMSEWFPPFAAIGKAEAAQLKSGRAVAGHQ
jgi:hypothetical protein